MERILNIITKEIAIAIFLCLFCGILPGCRKDPQVNVAEVPEDTTGEAECPLFPYYEGAQGGYTLQGDSTSYVMPYFNPDNDQEFLYVKKGYYALNSTIEKYNLQTSEHSVIYTGQIYSRPKWGKNDWIIFCPADENIWKVKSDGTNLTQITFSGGYFFPEFNYTGDKIIVKHKDVNHTSYIMDLDGTLLDTIDFQVDNNSNWQHPNYLVTYSYDIIKIIDVSTNSLVVSYNYPDALGLWGNVNWINENTIIWSERNGIHKSYMSLNKIIRLNKICGTFFHNGTINSSKTKLIWERYDYSYIDVENLKLDIRLIMLLPDGTILDTLNLP